MSVFEGPGEGTWSVFALRVVAPAPTNCAGIIVPAARVNMFSNCVHEWYYLGGHNQWWVCRKCGERERR